ncbi:MAG: ABC transporter ATP-binding protein, partial [Firmicutes bacterium]|nr:ABC transporter ATP-binding protein [Bacillota bacterium]
MSEKRTANGPGPRQRFERPQNVKGTLLRILSYLRPFRGRLILTAFCVILASLAGVAGTYFVKPIINRYLVPFIGQSNVDLSGFAHLMLVLVAIYLVGVAASYLQQYNMMIISTAVLRQVRTDMFDHMMGLKLKYFDSHTHGEIMSRYTNDTDTLREMVSQSLPNIFSSGLTVIGVFVMMLVLSPLLTLIVLAMLGVMMFVVKFVGKRSAAYFARQQKELGHLNGYIEEMITGVKVVKVFNHEQAVRDGFDGKNDDLFAAAKNAHTFASILMPIMGNLSYLTYAMISAAGAALAIAGRMDLGTIGSFLLYSRNFSNPITQISQQINTILAALAGAERIFALIDEP